MRFRTTLCVAAPLAALTLGACATLPDILLGLAQQATGNASQSPPPVQSGGPSPQPSVAEPAEAEPLLNAALSALNIENFDESVQAILPYVHKSLKNRTGTDLTTDIRQFSFKKAHANARFYAHPVHVTRVRENAVTGIGFGDTAEMGRTVDYFIAKKEGVDGLPAPVTVFFPSSGGPPRVSYLGSL